MLKSPNHVGLKPYKPLSNLLKISEICASHKSSCVGLISFCPVKPKKVGTSAGVEMGNVYLDFVSFLEMQHCFYVV